MDGDLSGFEHKIEQVVALCHSLREENRRLREQIAGLEGDNQALAAKIDTTCERLEALMSRLPEQ